MAVAAVTEAAKQGPCPECGGSVGTFVGLNRSRPICSVCCWTPGLAPKPPKGPLKYTQTFGDDTPLMGGLRCGHGNDETCTACPGKPGERELYSRLHAGARWMTPEEWGGTE